LAIILLKVLLSKETPVIYLKVIFCFFFISLSCTKKNDPPSSSQKRLEEAKEESPSPKNPEIQEEEESVNTSEDNLPQNMGKFVTQLYPINDVFEKSISGEFHLELDESYFKVKGKVLHSSSYEKHFQIIHTGESCPDISGDLNNDGWIDYFEGTHFYGHRLIHLDANLATQIEGIDYGPIGDERGNYSYQKRIDKEIFFDDLFSEDDDLFDDLKKLNLNQKLNLEKRVLVVYGISSKILLPLTVNEGIKNPNELVPVACGKVRRLR
jgi:hypothetical protein